MPDTYTFWTPTERSAFVAFWGDGTVDEGPMLGADEVICDACDCDICFTPVPLADGYALCDDCFKVRFGLTVEEAAAKEDIVITRKEEE